MGKSNAELAQLEQHANNSKASHICVKICQGQMVTDWKFYKPPKEAKELEAKLGLGDLQDAAGIDLTGTDQVVAGLHTFEIKAQPGQTPAQREYEYGSSAFDAFAPMNFVAAEEAAAMVGKVLKLPDNHDAQTMADLDSLLGSGVLMVSRPCYNLLVRDFPSLQSVLSPGSSQLAEQFAAILAWTPTTNSDGSEDLKGQLIYQYTGRVWSLLFQHAPQHAKPLTMKENRNSKVKSRSSTMLMPEESCRPDYTNVIAQLLGMCGEEKEDEDDFEDAWTDNERKLGAGFPLFSYPNIDAIFCYAAAHKLLQYALQPVAGGKPIRIKSAYNLDLAEQRVYALLAAVNIFRFFRPFVERAPLDARKRFDPSKIIPHGFSKLHFATSSKGWEVVKRIDFAENYFGGDLQSRFDTLQAVYDLIGECDAARSAIGQPRLIQKRLRSGSSRRNYIYEVRLHPVGYDTDIAEWDLSMLKAAMKAFFLCFAVMHKGGFVHTDPRWQNLIWMARLCPRVIDFESAQKLGYEVTHHHHELWDNGTLNSKGCYTGRSDLYQVGKILAIWAGKHPSGLIPSGMDLQRRLEAKTINAEQALSHSFLVG